MSAHHPTGSDPLGTDQTGRDHYRDARQRDNGTFLVPVELHRQVMDVYDAIPPESADHQPVPPQPAPSETQTQPRPEPERKLHSPLWHIGQCFVEGHYHTELRDRFAEVLRIEGFGRAADAVAALPDREVYGLRAGWAVAMLDLWIRCRAKGAPVPGPF